MKLYLKKVREVDQTVNPLFNFLGVIVDHISPNQSILRLPLTHNFLQGAGVIAGGILATLADEAMAHVVLANLNERQTTATIEMNIRYLRTIQDGEITAIAKIVKKGQQIITATTEIRDNKNILLADAGASFIVIKKK